jgi:simple sugar transport system permease protein
MCSERSGVVNIALEGIMIIGAYCGILVVNQLLPFMSDVPQLLFLLGMVAAAIGGVAFSYFHAVASVKMKADQIISATALNILAPALVLFLTMSLNLGEARGSDKILTHGTEFLISEVPILSKSRLSATSFSRMSISAFILPLPSSFCHISSFTRQDSDSDFGPAAKILMLPMLPA